MLRIELGYSQEYVAKKLKIAQSSYSQIESDQKPITIEKINEIAEIFEKNPLELILINGEPIKNIIQDQSKNESIVNNNYVISQLVFEKLVTELMKYLEEKR